MKTRRQPKRSSAAALVCAVASRNDRRSGTRRPGFFVERRPGSKHSRIRQATTTPRQPSIRTSEERIATFDQDGTLWVEHPIYTQVMYCLEKVPGWSRQSGTGQGRAVQHRIEVLHATRRRLEKLTMDDLMKILAATLTGMSVDDSAPR